MFTSQRLRFVRQVHPGNKKITESRCTQCSVVVVGGTQDKYLSIAEAVHKCRMISAPRLTRNDLSRLC